MEISDDFNAKLYIPGNLNYSCCYTSGSTIYCYRTTTLNNYNYRDIFNSSLGYVRYTDYVYIGSSFNSQCIESGRLTHNVFYRIDLDKILIIFVIIGIIPLLFIKNLHNIFYRRSK